MPAGPQDAPSTRARPCKLLGPSSGVGSCPAWRSVSSEEAHLGGERVARAAGTGGDLQPGALEGRPPVPGPSFLQEQ